MSYVFSRRILGGGVDSFRLTVEYANPTSIDDGTSRVAVQRSQSTLAGVVDRLEFNWSGEEAEAAVVARFAQKKSDVLIQNLSEHVVVRLSLLDSASTFPDAYVHVSLSVVGCAPVLRTMELTRTSSSGAVPDSLLRTLLQHCEIEAVLKVKANDGCGLFWSTCVDPNRWRSIRQLNLSHNSMTALPASIGQLPTLRMLRLSHNKLSSLPPELKHLTQLHVLTADHNLLMSVPAELKYLSSLHELHLEHNKITRLVLDVSNFSQLQSLQLFSNPVEFLPELSPCTQLRSLSIVNVRVLADLRYTRWEVEIANLSYMSRTNRLAPFFNLLLRRSSHHHPLLVGALAHLVEIDKANADLLANESMAVHQLMTMIMSNEPVVVQQACRVVAILAQDVLVAQKFVTSGVLRAVLSLITANRQDAQLGGLNVLSSIAESSEEAAKQLLTPAMQSTLQQLMASPVASVQQAAVLAVSNLAYSHANKIRILNTPALMKVLEQFADPHAKVATATRTAALRTLAVLGQNDMVQQALQVPPIKGRGVRVLAMDGGGMKGMAMVETLREIERRTGKRIYELFDLIAGTSTGGILAVSLGVHKKTLDECNDIYTSLGHKVFNQAGTATRDDSTSWKESLMRMYKSGSQSVRIAVYGSKHDASTFETLLKDICSPQNMGLLNDQMIDTAVLGGPKVFVVATLVSITPACPFVFCNYELPPDVVPATGAPTPAFHSSKARVWQAVRASSAAPYFLDEFSCGELRFQDGAATANNPSVLAVQQARLLWPHLPIECFVSLGVGRVPPALRERSVSSYLEVGNVLFESACAVERVDEAMATLLPLVQAPHPAGTGMMKTKYFRFTASDPRCCMDLDDVDPASWAELMQATREYLEQPAVQESLEECCALLNTGHTPPSRETDYIRLLPGQGIVLIEAPLAGPLLPEHNIGRVAKLVAQLPQLLAHCQLHQTDPPKSIHLTNPTPMQTTRTLSFQDTLPSLSAPLTPLSTEQPHLGLLSQYLNNATQTHGPQHLSTYEARLQALADGAATQQDTGPTHRRSQHDEDNHSSAPVSLDPSPVRDSVLSPTMTSTPVCATTPIRTSVDQPVCTSQSLFSPPGPSPRTAFITTPPHPSSSQDITLSSSSPKFEVPSLRSPGAPELGSPPIQIPTASLVPTSKGLTSQGALDAAHSPPHMHTSSPLTASPRPASTTQVPVLDPSSWPEQQAVSPSMNPISTAPATSPQALSSSPPLSHISRSPGSLTPTTGSPSRSRLSVSQFPAPDVTATPLTSSPLASPLRRSTHLTLQLDVDTGAPIAIERAGAQSEASPVGSTATATPDTHGRGGPAAAAAQQESNYQNVLSPTASQETSSIFSYFFSAWQSSTPAISPAPSKPPYPQPNIHHAASAVQPIPEDRPTAEPQRVFAHHHSMPVLRTSPHTTNLEPMPEEEAVDGREKGVAHTVDRGAHTGVHHALHTRANTGVYVGADTGANTGAYAGANTGAHAGANTGVHTGAYAGANAGAHTSADAKAEGSTPRIGMVDSMTSVFASPRASGPVTAEGGGAEECGAVGGRGEEGSEAGQFTSVPSLTSLTSPLSRLSHSLSTPGAAVIHLALHPPFASDTPHSSLVLSWHHQLLSTAEPGPEAAALVQQLGGVRGASLRQMFQTRSVLCGGGMMLVLLGIQEVQVTPTAKVRSYLMQKITPKDVLTVQDVRDMGRRGLWQDKVVVSGGQMAGEMADVLLEAGCKAVVSVEEREEVDGGVCQDVQGGGVGGFGRFYAALAEGKSLQECLEDAESAGYGAEHRLVCRTQSESQRQS